MSDNQHPLSDDLTKLSVDELDRRYTELMRRYATARRMNMAGGVMHQLDILLDGIEFEKMRRMQEPVDQDPVVIDTDRTTTTPSDKR
jgi:hypothetical protein